MGEHKLSSTTTPGVQRSGGSILSQNNIHKRKDYVHVGNQKGAVFVRDIVFEPHTGEDRKPHICKKPQEEMSLQRL